MEVSRAPKGSSPRMRGTQAKKFFCLAHCGLIPTYAGNTMTCSQVCCHSGAHPHVCGEHENNGEYMTIEEGSSPRMRGTPTLKSIVGEENGLIPTYAGNTCCSFL
ncbi:hypothetical protein HMPREF1324_1145 [Rothia aeria F0474]|nr:hypothetical protein HMPREF1324_1145 [Rothia aeria F0474]